MRRWLRGRPGPPVGREAPPSPPGATPLAFDDAFLRRLERLSLSVRRVVDTVGGRPGPRRTPAADFVDHRPYSPGDDRRHIDWNAAARQDEVFVKIGRAPQAASLHLALDESPSVRAWPAKHRLSLELAAAIGWMTLAHGDRLTLASCPAPAERPAWGPASGAGHGPALLGWLAAGSPTPAAETRLLPVVQGLVRASPAGGMLVILSDLWVEDDLDRLLRLAPAPRWETLVLQVLDRSELEPALSGALELADVESGRELRLELDAALLTAYRRALNERLGRLAALCAARGASYAMVPADWPLEQAVLPYLQRRAVFG